MRRFTCILTILICAFAYNGILSASNPTKPDSSIYSNAERQYNDWWRNTINPAKTNVDNAFNAAMTLVNDFKNANASIRATMYPALPASIKDKVVSAVSSALSLAVSMATEMVRAMTLEGAASTVFGNHTTKLDTFNDYWDGRGTVTESDTLALMQVELNQHGQIGVQAYSLMGAFHRLEYALGIFNIKAEKWNKHSPSDPVQIQYISDPIKPGFSTVGCFNHCGDTFDTFTSAESSHKEKCGTGDNIDLFDMRRPANEYNAYLGSRTVAQGCGRHYYDCEKKPAGTEHKEQTCSIWVWEKPTGYLNAFKSYKCGHQFRECMWWLTRDHNPHDLNPFEATHSASGDSSTDNPPSDDDDDDGDSTEQDTQGLQTEQTQTSTPSYHTCGVHETSVSGDHSAAGCGVSGHYVCDGSDHSLQASCTSTDANGEECDVTGFYACQSHTCVYPEPTEVLCSRSSCNEVVSTSDEHYVQCSGCSNSYWSCDSDAVHRHRVKTCRFDNCDQTWYACASTPICNKPWRRQNNKKCQAQ